MKVKRHTIFELLRIKQPPALFYVTDEANWVLHWVGHYITTEINSQFGINAHLDRPLKAARRNDIVHFGSLWNTVGALKSTNLQRQLKSRKLIATIFHGQRNAGLPEFDHAFDTLLCNLERFAGFVTASSQMETRLLEWEIPPQLVHRIPLGVDPERFFPVQEIEKMRLRMELGIPENTICIGSFQKDGVGWGDGMEPKLIKGPDVFLEAIRILARVHPLFVLLTGPARGYVKSGLEKIGVPFRHVELDDFHKIPSFYQCLDLYMIASREEGGPQAVLEAPACGIPVISTRVGLAPDIIEDGVSGRLVPVEDAAALAAAVADLIDSPETRRNISVAGLKKINQYSWKNVARRYFEEIYQPLFESKL